MADQRRKLHRQRSRVRRLIPIVFFVILILCISLVLGVFFRYKPSNEQYTLTDYYQMQEGDVAVIIGEEVSEEHARQIGDSVYLPYTLLQSSVNDRFYWDASQNKLLYTTASEVLSYDLGEDVMLLDGAVWVSLELVQVHTPMECEQYESPARVVMDTQAREVTTAQVDSDTQVRYRGGIKSPILTQVKQGDTVRVLEHGEDWTQVRTQDGLVGYIQKRYLTDEQVVMLDIASKNDGFISLVRDHKICMVWHQVTSVAQNDNISSRLAQTKGINVVSPTWFYIADGSGSITSLASSAYVEYVHGLGMEVWGLVDNFTTLDLPMSEILGSASTRAHMIDQLIQYATEYSLDGINVDFEELGEDTGESFVQFIRELALRCHENNLVLSVDNHVPYQFNSFYNMEEQSAFADYIIMMSYDEHLNESTGAGSVASIEYVTTAIERTLQQGVPAEKLINAVPFYTRIWSETPMSAEEAAAAASGGERESYTLGWETLGMASAAEQVAQHGASPVWDDTLKQNYAEYTVDGVNYKVWLEDTQSLEERLKVMQASGVGGFAAWKLGLESSDVWDVIINYYP